ncbi:MAG: ABC transporter permease [bacterium]|nr:ABC transporter permease [bacterium]
MGGRRIPLWKMAWRSVWRNRRRTAITTAALVISAASFIWLYAFLKGFSVKMVEDTIAGGIGHVQIHADGFNVNPTTDKVIAAPEALENEISQIPEVKAFAPRVKFSGIAQTPYNAIGCSVLGVDPRREMDVSIFSERIIEGEWFADGEGAYGVIIGYKMAENMEAELGDLVAVIAQDIDGDISAEAFELVGIIKTGNPEIDNAQVLLPIYEAQRIIGYDDQISEIVIVAEGPKAVDPLKLVVLEIVPEEGYEVLTWYEVSKMAYEYYNIMIGTFIFIMLLFIVLASFGVMNTVLNSILERIKEFGLLKALGVRPRQIFGLILLEGFALSLLGLVLGIVSGWLITFPFTLTGINVSFWSEGMGLIGSLDPVIPMVLDFGAYLFAGIIVVITGLLSAVYPAFKAARIRPVIAMRQE